MKILVVEDNTDIQAMLNRKLSRQGWEVYFADNGEEGVVKAWELMPDLILMDIHMPVMDGYEATRTLREKGYSGKISALTASVMQEDTRQAIENGCDSFIAKPIGRDFIEQLKAILEIEDPA